MGELKRDDDYEYGYDHLYKEEKPIAAEERKAVFALAVSEQVAQAAPRLQIKRQRLAAQAGLPLAALLHVFELEGEGKALIDVVLRPVLKRQQVALGEGLFRRIIGKIHDCIPPEIHRCA